MVIIINSQQRFKIKISKIIVHYSPDVLLVLPLLIKTNAATFEVKTTSLKI